MAMGGLLKLMTRRVRRTRLTCYDMQSPQRRNVATLGRVKGTGDPFWRRLSAALASSRRDANSPIADAAQVCFSRLSSACGTERLMAALASSRRNVDGPTADTAQAHYHTISEVSFRFAVSCVCLVKKQTCRKTRPPRQSRVSLFLL